MILTIRYVLPSGKTAIHSGSGESFTAFLRMLESERIRYEFVGNGKTSLNIPNMKGK